MAMMDRHAYVDGRHGYQFNIEVDGNNEYLGGGGEGEGGGGV